MTSSLVPVSILITAYIAVLAETTSGIRTTAAWWNDRKIAEQVAIALAYGNVVWFLASLYSSNWRRIVRLYEGYPLRRFVNRLAGPSVERRLAIGDFVPGVAFHVRRRARLGTTGTTGRLVREYAPDDYRAEILPTALGNSLLAAERYALHRYGLDITVLWPRLYRQLPEATQRELETFREEHQMPVSLSFAALIFAATSSITVWLTGGPADLFVLCAGGGGSAFLVAYWLSLERTREYGEQLRAVVDLYHGRLFDEWSGPPFSDVLLARRFERAAAFVTGRDPNKETLAKWSLDGSAAPEQDGQSGTRQIAYDPLPRLLAGKFGLAANAVISSVRLSFAAALLVASVTALGYIHLSSRQTTVATVTSAAEAGALIDSSKLELIRVPAESVRHRDPLTSVSADAYILISDLERGDVVLSTNIFPTSELSEITLPLGSEIGSQNVVEGDAVSVLFGPCGVRIDNLILRLLDSSATVAGPIASFDQLDGCDVQSVVLITQGDQADS